MTSETQNNQIIDHGDGRSGLLTGFRCVILVGALALAGCSQVPDALNPVEWYDSVEDAITGDDDEVANTPQPEAGGAEAPDVPQQSQTQPPPSGGLVADVDGRQYDDAVPLQGEAQNALAPAPPSAAVAQAPGQSAPPARPASPVQTQTVQAPVMRPPSGTAAGAPTATRPPALPAAPALTANSAGSQQLAVNSQSQIAYQARLDAMRARMGGRNLGSNAASLPPGQSYGQLQGNVQETIVISSGGVQGALPSRPVGGSVGPATVGPVSFGNAAAMAPNGTRVATILFPNGATTISNRARQILGQVAQLQRERGGRLQVVGHSSSRTGNLSPDLHKKVNMDISIARADKVARELRRFGVQEASLMVSAVGDMQPLYYEIMPSGEAGNRRAEIYLTN